MLGKDSVRSRMDSGAGLSFTEFSYQLFQAHDFLHLYQRHSCVMQVRCLCVGRLRVVLWQASSHHERLAWWDVRLAALAVGRRRPVGQHHRRH